ncbi:Protein of unknown function [Thermobacillus xylanilyticus]|uniref:Uncharacterized protein n=1 Tax=Thermobacillus xylanilyticus TaxID=76633 RepID=A0ABM8V7I0_THEXY|nr:Protein of unknown function [Thermobacillus xylanilyticus]
MPRHAEEQRYAAAVYRMKVERMGNPAACDARQSGLRMRL